MEAEHAFTLVEVTIVVLLATVLSAIAITTMHSSRVAASDQTVRTVGRALDEGIRAFRSDRGSRTPVLNSADWPNASFGPVDRNTEMYLRRRVDPLSDGSVQIVAHQDCGWTECNQGVPGPGMIGRLRYQQPTPTTYRIIVEGKGAGAWRRLCWFGNTVDPPLGGLSRC
jgi:type II secretory pathway pseudopilin PulG